MGVHHALALLLLAVQGAPQDRLLREAARLDTEGKCAEAERLYQEALGEGPVTPALLNNAGNHYLMCGQPAKARLYFEQLLKANPSHQNANLQLARIATDGRQGGKALEYLSRVEDSGPAVRLLRAEASHWAGKRAEAASMLAGLEKEARGDPRVLFALGLAYARIGRFESAEAAFHAVLVKQPGNFEVLFNLGRAAARAGHDERARSALEAALKVRPGDVDTLLELGLAWAAGRDYGRAVFVLAQARQRAPKRPGVLLALARAAEDGAFWGDSALAYDEYLQLRPGDDKARRDRARVYGYTGTRLEEGLREMAWYVGKYPKDPQGHYNLAQFTWRTEPEKSLEQMRTALRLDPRFTPAQVSLAWLLHRLGRTAEAVPYLESAVRAEPDNLRALDQLGVAYQALDRGAEAEKALRRALELAPDDPEVLLHMGRTLMALGRDEEAQGFLGKYQKVRPRRFRGARTEPGMIESATLSDSERRDREIERFRRMSASRPDDPKLQFHLADLLLADGRVDEAAGEFRKLLTQNADSAIWREAGKSLLRAEQYALARDFLERAATDTPEARLDLAIALFFTQGPEEALKAVEEMPEGERAGDYLLMKARILDASGRVAEAEKVLLEGLRYSSIRPDVAQQASLLLVRHERHAEAVALLERAMKGAPDDAGLPLTNAIVLGLLDRNADAEKALQQLEARWPEWDRPYLAHALLLERGNRSAEARRKIQAAMALGSRDLAVRCAAARLTGAPEPEPQCRCVKGLRELLFPACPVSPPAARGADSRR